MDVGELLKNTISVFLKGKVDEFVLKINTSLKEDEFKGLTSDHHFDDKHTYNNDSVTIDEYEYILDGTFEKVLEIEYVKQDDNTIFVFAIKGYVATW